MSAEAIAAEFLEEARDTFRRLGRLLPRSRRVDELERQVGRLSRRLEVEGRTVDGLAREADVLERDLAALAGVVGSNIPPDLLELELGDLMATRPAIRILLERTVELRRRHYAAKRALEEELVRQAVELTLGDVPFELDLEGDEYALRVPDLELELEIYSRAAIPGRLMAELEDLVEAGR